MSIRRRGSIIPSRQGLQSLLERKCLGRFRFEDKTGNHVLAMAHNGTVSNMLMFRMIPYLSPNDGFADYGTRD